MATRTHLLAVSLVLLAVPAAGDAAPAGPPPDASQAPAGQEQPVAPAGPVANPEAEDAGQRTTVVTGTRTPRRLEDSAVPTEVVSRKLIEESGSRTVAEALRAVPGLETLPGLTGTTQVRMQGLGPEYNLLVVDGQRAVGRVNGAYNLNRYGSGDVEQIEIVKGPSSVLWGSDALAGVIQIVTRRPERSLGGEAQVSWGGYDQLDARAGAESRVGEVGLRASVDFQRRDAIRLDPSTIYTDASEFRTLEGTVRATRGDPRGGTYLDVRLAGSLRFTHGVDTETAGAVFDTETGSKLLEGTAVLRLDAGPGTLSVSANGAQFQERYVHDHRGVTSNDTQEDSTDRTGLTTVTYALPLGEHLVTAGGDALVEQLQAVRLQGDERRRERGAVFLQDEWRLSEAPRLVAVAGVRGDLDTQFGNVVTPRLAVRWDPVSSLAVRAAVGTGFRAPSFQELYLTWDNPTAGYQVRGNPDLSPERSVGATLSADWTPVRAVTLSGSVFWNRLRNMIAYTFEETPTVLKTSYGNTARAVTQGGELSAAWAVNRWLTAGAGYTFTHARDLGTKLELEGQATHRVLGQLRVHLRELGLTGFARAAWTSRRPFVDGELGTTVYEDPFLLLDARVAWRVRWGLELFVSGNNLAGAGDASYLPIAPRSFLGGTSFTY